MVDIHRQRLKHQPFAVSIDNQTRATDYLLTCVLDYQQIPCLWEDETEPAYHYSVSLSAGQIRNIGFKTPEITEGAHDFVVLAFRNAFSTKLDYEYRISTDFNYFHAPRIVLLAGDSTEFPELPDSSLITGEPDILPMPLDGLLVTQSSSVDRISAWLMQPASPDEIFDYTIYLGNYSRPEDTRHYAVMSFLNYRQVPLSEQQDVMFANLDFLEQTTFEASVQAPADEGIYELVVIYATDPYTMLENPPTGETRELVPVNRNLYSSIRTAIVVEEQD